MARRATTPKTAPALADYLAEHPLVWVCGLPGGAFAGVVSRIDGDRVEFTTLSGGRRRQVRMPSGWSSRKRRPPVRTRALRDAFCFHEAGFSVSCVERRHPHEVLHLHVRYLDEKDPFR
jgi:hypothetical protein